MMTIRTNHQTRALGLLISLIVAALCQACSDQEVRIPTCPIAANPQQIDADSLIRVIDDLQGQCDSVSRDLCRLTLIEAERRRQTRCLFNWLAEHNIAAPEDCSGRSIDLTVCDGGPSLMDESDGEGR